MRRLETGSLVAALGAALLLVSLFLAWFAPDLTAWDAFEVLDLVLAGLALAALAAAAAELDWWRGPLPGVDILLAGTCALVIVVAALVIDRPAAIGRGVEDGAWLGLAGAALMFAGGVLARAGISLSVSVGPRPAGPPGAASARGRRSPAATPGPPAAGAGPSAGPARVPGTSPPAAGAPRRRVSGSVAPAPAPAPSPSPPRRRGAGRLLGDGPEDRSSRGRAGIRPGVGERPAGQPAAGPPAGEPDDRSSPRPGRPPAGEPDVRPPDSPGARRWRPRRRAAPVWEDETEVTRPLPPDTDLGPPPPKR